MEEMIEMACGGYPRCNTLRHGAVLVTIAHAIFSAPLREPLNTCWWDGVNYVLNNHSGARGAVTFDGDVIVGTFFDLHSPRNPLPPGRPFDAAPLLEGMPEHLLRLARREAMQFVYYEYQGIMMPLITAACWSKDGCIVAAEPWTAVLEHGGDLIRIESMVVEEALPELENEYLFEPIQMELLQRLFERKMEEQSRVVVLDRHDWDILIRKGMDGIDESRELLASVGIQANPY